MPITTQRNGHNKVFTVNIIIYNGYKKHIMAVAKIVCNGHIKTFTGDIKTLIKASNECNKVYNGHRHGCNDHITNI